VEKFEGKFVPSGKNLDYLIKQLRIAGHKLPAVTHNKLRMMLAMDDIGSLIMGMAPSIIKHGAPLVEHLWDRFAPRLLGDTAAGAIKDIGKSLLSSFALKRQGHATVPTGGDEGIQSFDFDRGFALAPYIKTAVPGVNFYRNGQTP